MDSVFWLEHSLKNMYYEGIMQLEIEKTAQEDLLILHLGDRFQCRNLYKKDSRTHVYSENPLIVNASTLLQKTDSIYGG